MTRFGTRNGSRIRGLTRAANLRSVAPRSDRRTARRRSAGEVLRARTPIHFPEILPAAPPVVRPSLGRRILGAILLIGTVTLVSCQAVMTAFSPGLY